MGLNIKQVSRATSIIMGCYRAFRDKDATKLEINPLVVTKDDRVIALDAKMSFDDNAMFRLPDIAEMRDLAQEDPREAEASQHNLNYVGLDGDIGCIINGAGLAMATMDTIKYAGGEPANFLDVGGGASPERVAVAFKLVLSDPNVSAILVNIFAGINRCDWIAEGVVAAAKGLRVPLIVRLVGTNYIEGRKIIENSGLPIISAETLLEACEKSVAAAKEHRAKHGM
jgi:malate-CoA ligase subunit beta